MPYVLEDGTVVQERPLKWKQLRSGPSENQGPVGYVVDSVLGVLNFFW